MDEHDDTGLLYIKIVVTFSVDLISLYDRNSASIFISVSLLNRY